MVVRRGVRPVIPVLRMVQAAGQTTQEDDRDRPSTGDILENNVSSEIN